MTQFTPLLLLALAALFFFLPGLAVVLALAGGGSGIRKDDVHLITFSIGLSLALTIIVMYLLLLIADVTGSAFQFEALPVVLAALTIIFLAIAAIRGRLPGLEWLGATEGSTRGDRD
jgi:uncharacterized membrane protein